MASITQSPDEDEEFIVDTAPAADCSRIITVKQLDIVVMQTHEGQVEEPIPAAEIPDEPEPIAEDQKAKAEPRGTTIPSHKDKWIIERVLGRGGFGVVYKVRSEKDGKVYALKTEEKKTEEVYRRLKCESWIMYCMSQRKSAYYLDLIDCGQTSNYNFVVMPLIGRSLDVIKKTLVLDEQFSKSTTVKVMLATLEAIEDMHAAGFLHRDVKPANFAVGLEDWSRIYILDFGISRHYRDHDGSVIKPRKAVPFIGTLRYAPRSSHACTEYGRVGDLESWLFMGLEMWNAPFLPWYNEPDKNRYYDHKRDVLNSVSRYLLANPKMPFQFCKIAMHIGSLEGPSEPDYAMIKNLLISTEKSDKKIDLKEDFDWAKKEAMMWHKQIAEANRLKKKEEGGMTCATNAEQYFVYAV